MKRFVSALAVGSVFFATFVATPHSVVAQPPTYWVIDCAADMNWKVASPADEIGEHVRACHSARGIATITPFFE
jgi:hypothetical protein